MIKPRQLIGISGAAGSGKDTVGDYLVKEYGYTKLAYADALKDLVRFFFNIPKTELTSGQKSEEVRRLLQGTGELAKYLKGRYYWNNELDKSMASATGPVVITDVKFNHEIEHIRKNNGVIIRVSRQNIDLQTKDTGHISETELSDGHPGFDFVIYNNGTLNELYLRIEEIMRDLICRGIPGETTYRADNCML